MAYTRVDFTNPAGDLVAYGCTHELSLTILKCLTFPHSDHTKYVGKSSSHEVNHSVHGLNHAHAFGSEQCQILRRWRKGHRGQGCRIDAIFVSDVQSRVLVVPDVAINRAVHPLPSPVKALSSRHKRDSSTVLHVPCSLRGHFAAPRRRYWAHCISETRKMDHDELSALPPENAVLFPSKSSKRTSVSRASSLNPQWRSTVLRDGSTSPLVSSAAMDSPGYHPKEVCGRDKHWMESQLSLCRRLMDQHQNGLLRRPYLHRRHVAIL